MVADVAADSSEPWWIIGSAAVALHGAPAPAVRDIDLLMEPADARHFLARVGAPSDPGRDHPQFRSAVFGTWREPPLPVEIFADFRIRGADGWRRIRLESREAVSVAGRTVFVPSSAELHALLLSFGRPKDVERARLLAPPNAAAGRPAPGPSPGRHR
jgi:hypothetical protein